ncbi:anti-sigma regulatory factor [soil metagenome]
MRKRNPMEIAYGSVHTVFPMEDISRVGEARRHAVQLANLSEFDEVTTGRVALVVTELGTNLVKHATKGRLLIATRGYADRASEIEVLSMDEGPGILDIERSMRDGFSTAGTPGTGLGAVKRLADDFDMVSASPSGTLVVARVRARQHRGEGIFRFGTVAIAAPGEKVSGDGWMLATDGSKANAFMVDGLGHGPMAEEAAKTAIDHFQKRPFHDLAALMQSAHEMLRPTRGAAVAAASLDSDASVILSLGAGNVVLRVCSGVSDRTLLTQQGTVGLSIRKPEVVSTPWPAHAVLVLHTDGVMQRWPRVAVDPLLVRDPSLTAALLVRDFCRGRDDATVMVVRRK